VDRYRLALCPAIAIFFAAGIFILVQKWRVRHWGTVAIACVWLLVSLLLGFWPTPESKSPMVMEYYLLGNAYLITGKPVSAIACYDTLLEAQPDNKEAINNRIIAIRMLKGDDISLPKDMKTYGKTDKN
jgi:hypothetical protein